MLRNYWLTALGAAAFAVFGLWALQDSIGVPALEWGGLWREGDFGSYHDIANFYRHLRAGIPAFITLIELIVHVQFDRLQWLLTSVFRFFFVLTFMLPFLFFARSRLHRLAIFLTCFVFFWSAVIITPSNQQVYDLYYPFFVLAFLVSVKFAAAANNAWTLTIACLTVGFFISMIELARPFALLLLPVLALHAGFAMRHLKKRYMLIALIPVLLLSGGWHAKLFFLHDGQVFWSNNGGYNLYRNWEAEMDEEPELLDPNAAENQALKTDPFPGTGKMAVFSLNSDFHSRNSKLIQAAVLDHIFEHPVSAVKHVLEGVGTIFRPQLIIFRLMGGEPWPESMVLEYTPKQPVIKVYPWFVWVSAAIVLANFFAMLAYLLVRRRLDFFKQPETCLTLVIITTTLFLAVGEKGEEARFLVSMLPLMAVLPFGFRIRRNPAGGVRIELGGQQAPQ